MNCPACGKKLEIFDEATLLTHERYICYPCKYIVVIIDYDDDNDISDEIDEENSNEGC